MKNASLLKKIKAINNGINSNRKRIESLELKKRALEQERRKIESGLTLKRRCELAKLDYFSVNDDVALVAFKNCAFLVWESKEAGNSGKIFLAIEDTFRKEFSSVCLCGYHVDNLEKDGCGYTENARSIVNEVIKVAKENRIEKVITRTKQDRFAVEGVEFIEIYGVMKKEKFAEKLGEEVCDLFETFFYSCN